MNLFNLLQSEEAKLPKIGVLDIENQLKDMFATYVAAVRSMNAKDEATQNVVNDVKSIESLGNAVTSALGAWLDGRPEKSVLELNRGFQISAIAESLEKLSSKDVFGDAPGPLFRIRTGQLNVRFECSDLFHIPFEQRDRVATQRYSFPGLPCLYFGRSLYVCWEEFGRPELSTVWASKFKLQKNESLRVLDFGRRPEAIVTLAKRFSGVAPPKIEFASAYAKLWPLIAACSMKRRPDSQKGFVVEYIIPQLLLRWVIEQQNSAPSSATPTLDGIRYFSTHIDDHKVNLAGMNYVFPIRKRSTSGFCSVLKSKFQMPHPVNWQIATTVNMQPSQQKSNYLEFELTPGLLVEYQKTKFSWVERFLQDRPLLPVP